jgi:multidrug efflux pump subunit AcrB
VRVLIDATLYDAFGERQVSTMYTPLNQYHVIMEAAPQYWENPLILRDIYVRSPGGKRSSVECLHEIRFPHRASFRQPPGALTLL